MKMYLLRLTPLTVTLSPTASTAPRSIKASTPNTIFSSDMFIATLNYSVSYTYASLHKLTLLRLLDQKRLLDQNIDENGNRYRLVVTPEEKPECFEPAA